MKRFIAVCMCLITLIAALPFTAFALTQDEIFEEMTVNDMLVMNGQVFTIYNYKELLLSYSVSDPEVISNDGDGVFTALKAGTCDIILTLGKQSKSFKVTVCEPESKVSGIGGTPELGYFGSKSVFGEETVTLLTSDGYLYFITANDRTLVAKDVKEYHPVGSLINWNQLDIITTDGKYYRWTYDTETKKSESTLLYDYIPKEVNSLYIMTDDGTVLDAETKETVCTDAKKITEYGYILFNDGSVKDAKNAMADVTTAATDIDTAYPLVIKDSGALFMFNKEDDNSYSAKLIDSGVTGFVSSTRLYTKNDDTTKLYNGERGLLICSFAASDALESGNTIFLARKNGMVYTETDFDVSTLEELGDDFSYFYDDGEYIGFVNTSGILKTADGTQKNIYGKIDGSDFKIDEDGALYTNFGTGEYVKVMESVLTMVFSPADGNSAFILRADGSVWHCDKWTWYPRKESESSRFYPKKYFIEYTLGDVNEDSKITLSDVRLTLRLAARLESLSPAQQKAADINADGKVTAADARALLRHVAGLMIIDFINNNTGKDDDSKG